MQKRMGSISTFIAGVTLMALGLAGTARAALVATDLNTGGTEITTPTIPTGWTRATWRLPCPAFDQRCPPLRLNCPEPRS